MTLNSGVEVERFDTSRVLQHILIKERIKMEEWLDVTGYEQLFSISSNGQLFSKRTGRILKQVKHTNGYMHIATKIGGRKGVNKCFKVHRLVAEAFLVNLKGKPQVNHLDGDKTNNNKMNLEWVTPSENQLHAYRTGLNKPTDMRKHRKLNPADVKEIRSRCVKNCRVNGVRALAREFGVGRDCITRVVERKTYLHE